MKYVQEAFDGNWIAPLGPNVDGFEKDLEQFLGEGTHVAAVNTGTAALHLALVMLGVEKDDYVICQSLTFSASANPIIYLGGIPIFVDSEPDTWNICPNALEDAVKSCIKKGKKPKAIIAVACERDLTSGIQDVFPLPGIGVLNERPFGPCFNTRVDISKVEDTIKYFLKNEDKNDKNN